MISVLTESFSHPPINASAGTVMTATGMMRLEYSADKEYPTLLEITADSEF